MGDRIRVGGFSSRTQATLARGFLADQGIEATVVTDDAGGAAPFVAMGNHGVSLLVAAGDADRARTLLADLTDDNAAASESLRPWMSLVGRVLLAVVAVGILASLVVRATGG